MLLPKFFLRMRCFVVLVTIMADYLNRQTAELREILHIAGLPALIERFIAEKIDSKLIPTLNDDDMIRLGVATIGDRIRLREEAKRKLQVRTQNGFWSTRTLVNS